MSASVQTTYRPYASPVPIRRAVPDPPLRRNGISRMLGKRGSASCSTASVLSVDLSSITSNSYENPLASIAALIRWISAMTCSCSL